MSKYDPLWKWINKNKTDDFQLTYAEIENIVGVPIDHSFLTFKKGTFAVWFQGGKNFYEGADSNIRKTGETE